MKKFLIMTLIAAMAIGVVGCGANQSANSQTSVNEQTSADNQSTGDSSTQTDASTDTIDEPIDPSLPQLNVYDVGQYDHHYISSYNALQLIGLKEYDSLDGDFGADTPAEGNKYLVVFLEIRNTWDDPFYFSPDELTVQVDGVDTERTYLINNPDNYKPIFQTVNPDSRIQGYFVCEVPANWQSLTYTYSGWQYTIEQGLAIVTDTVTPSDLFDPEAIQ